VNVRILGPARGYPGHDLEAPLRSSPLLRHLSPFPVWDDDYAKALNAASIALCFLSKRNRDVYTRRCFEIPATGTLMLCEHSGVLGTLFAEGVDADYFRSPAELVSKAAFYLSNADVRLRVAESGRARAHADGHDVDSRVKTMLDTVFPSQPRRATA
jgi:spore maturation protein CgeB